MSAAAQRRRNRLRVRVGVSRDLRRRASPARPIPSESAFTDGIAAYLWSSGWSDRRAAQVGLHRDALLLGVHVDQRAGLRLDRDHSVDSGRSSRSGTDFARVVDTSRLLGRCEERPDIGQRPVDVDPVGRAAAARVARP